MKIAIAAGGTGGHIYPGIAVAEEFLSRDPQNGLIFIGCHDGLEKELVSKEGYEIKLIYARGILRKISYKAISAPFLTFFGFFQSLFILKNFNPSLVVVTGGYVSFPVTVAAKILGIKVVLLEQNTIPGFVSKLISRFVDAVVVSFAEAQKTLQKSLLFGNPVRRKFFTKKVSAKKEFNKVVIVGGSQGARKINFEVLNILDLFIGKNIELVHITGKRDFDEIMSKVDALKYGFYKPLSYVYNIEEELFDADLVVSRSGATAIAEFLVLGLPMILIPFPYSAENHQEANAEAVQNMGAGIVLNESDIEKLGDIISSVVFDEENLKAMKMNARKNAKDNASTEIVNLIYELTKH